MGDIALLSSDPYCNSRGLLPRLLEDTFNLSCAQRHTAFTLTCSYIEIYNEQIFDLVKLRLSSFPRTSGCTRSGKTLGKACSWKA